jgi:hypothetical protein
MSETPDHDWSDLARIWQADAVRVAMQDIEAHLRRQRRHLLAVAAAEWGALAIGALAACWLLFGTPMRVLGLIVGVFTMGSAWLSIRMKQPPPQTGADLLQSLKDFVAREDWLIGQLRIGRGISLMALAAIVVATSMQLLRAQAFLPAMLSAAAVGCGIAVVALSWNYVLYRRSRARRERLIELSKKVDP